LSSVAVSNLSKRYGLVEAVHDLTLEVREGEMLVMIGPSGCGKTTCLRCLAGLERPSGGRIAIDGKLVTAVDRGVFLAPERREIGMVFQSYAIWPHLTVFENIAYPLHAMRLPRQEIRRQVEEILRLTRLEGLAGRYSAEISGGQQQRVALARSLAGRPKLLLFDEPLSNLDANLRVEMRDEIKDLQRRLGFTGFYVTHDQVEAMVVADRIAVMLGGRIRQIGTPEQLYERPESAFVASFMGAANLLPGVVRHCGHTGAEVAIEGGLSVLVPGGGAPAGRAVQVSIRPEAIRLRPGAPREDADEWAGQVRAATYLGSAIIYRVQVGPWLLDVLAGPDERLPAGAAVAVATVPSRRVLIDEPGRAEPGR
jgi:iron(III) transport system ATP-binding protein